MLASTCAINAVMYNLALKKALKFVAYHPDTFYLTFLKGRKCKDQVICHIQEKKHSGFGHNFSLVYKTSIPDLAHLICHT